MQNFKDLVTKSLIDTKGVLDLFCFRNKTNILSLREILGDETFLMLLDRFNGQYIRFPKFEKLSEIWEDAVLAELHSALSAANRAVPRGDKEDKKPALLKVVAIEQKFLKHCEKMKIDYKTAVRRVKAIKADLKKAAQWKSELDTFNKKEPKDIL